MSYLFRKKVRQKIKMSQPLLIKFVCLFVCFTGNHVLILIFHLDPPSPIFQKKKVPVNSLILSHLTCRQFLVFHLKNSISLTEMFITDLD